MLYLLFGALCISTAPLFVKFIESGSTFVAFGRCLFGGLFLSYFLYRDRKKLISSLMDWKIFRWLFLAGFIFFIDLFIWHKSIHYIGAGKATVLGNTQVFYATILGVLFYKEKLNWNFLLGISLAVIGITLLIWFDTPKVEPHLYFNGIIFGLCTGVVYGIYIFSLSKASRYYQSNHKKHLAISDGSKLGIVCFISAFFLLPATIYEHQWKIPAYDQVLLIMALGFIPQFMGWLSIKKGLGLVPISISGLILLLQPVLASIGGVIFFGEVFSTIQMIGMFITIIGIAFGSLKLSKKKPSN